MAAMQIIRYGRLESKNSMPKHASKGATEPFYGTARLDDGSMAKVYVKNMPSINIINEVIAAILGNLMGLNVPTAVIIMANKKQFGLQSDTEAGDDVLLFGSLDCGINYLKTMLHLRESVNFQPIVRIWG